MTQLSTEHIGKGGLLKKRRIDCEEEVSCKWWLLVELEEEWDEYD